MQAQPRLLRQTHPCTLSAQLSIDCALVNKLSAWLPAHVYMLLITAVPTA